MVRYNRSMLGLVNSDRQRVRQKTEQKVELSDYCKQYLRGHHLFDWFIECYYGKAKVLELWNLAEANEGEHIRNELNGIWFGLPDHIFNIQNNPQGWEAFLNLVEE